ncbi:hypothetical protein BKA61DRAFT_733864 [Leptodontidium sp. MPI-SDFR-AT-0119]|nr:hypothetical protein BKA61DRAFT_733864 [Leptodontidium sp. MPI-SDFR-AT-0119]
MGSSPLDHSNFISPRCRLYLRRRHLQQMETNARGLPEEHEMEDAPMMRSDRGLHDESIQSPSLKLDPATQETEQHTHYKMLPKKSKSRRHALIKCLVLIPPLAVSLAILSLNFSNVFWGQPSSNTNNILSALQFTAQLHASLIVASISAMVLSVVQYGLASKRGVPLGFISASFNVDSFFYMFRKEFTTLNLKYVILFPCVLALALLSGPSSAIAMIPRLQFWSVNKVWADKGNLDFKVYIQTSQDGLYPETLTAQNSPPQCGGANASILQECPSFGIRQWVMDDDISSGSLTLSINKTVNGDWVRYLVGQSTGVFAGTSSSYSSSSLSTFLGNTLIAYDNYLRGFQSRYIGNNDGPGTMQRKAADDYSNLRVRYDLSFRTAGKEIPTRKPVVEAQCSGAPANSSTFVLPHDVMLLAPSTNDQTAPTKWSVSASKYSDLLADLNSTIVNSSWIDPEQFGSFKPSLGAIFATPEIIHGQGSINDDRSPFSFFVCTFDARWMTTKTYLDMATNSKYVYDSFPDPADAIYGEETSYHPIKDISATHAFIDESWANLLDVPWIDSLSNPTATNRSTIDMIGQKCLDKHSFLNATFGTTYKPLDDGSLYRVTPDIMTMYECLQTSLSVYLTDSLARTQDSIPAYVVIEGQVHPTDSGYPSKVFLSQSLYGDPQELLVERRAFTTNLTKADFEDTSRFTEIHMKVSRYGYGYGFQDSILIYVSAVVLLLHATICFAYLAWVLSVGVYPGEQVVTVGELLVMGIQSGKLSGAGDNVTLKDANKNPKTTWTGRFGLRYAGSRGDGLSIDEDKGARSVILKKLDDWDEKEDILR